MQRNPFFRLIEPLIDQARTERSKAAASDPDYYRRIDARLNEDRINVLAVGYGWRREGQIGYSVYAIR